MKFVLTNAQTQQNDTVVSKIEVLKDAHPGIEVSEEQDSVVDGRKYFQGAISDDYGLSKLQLQYL